MWEVLGSNPLGSNFLEKKKKIQIFKNFFFTWFHLKTLPQVEMSWFRENRGILFSLPISQNRWYLGYLLSDFQSVNVHWCVISISMLSEGLIQRQSDMGGRGFESQSGPNGKFHKTGDISAIYYPIFIL